MKVPWQLPAILYGAGLIAIAVVLSFGRSAPTFFPCLPSEQSIGLCVRGWLPPLSGLASFIIAMLAWTIAHDQRRIARQNQRLAVVKDRLERVGKIIGVASEINGAFHVSRMALDLLCKAPDGVNLHPMLKDAREKIESLNDKRNDMLPLTKDATTGAGLRNIAEDIRLTSDLEMLYSTRNLVSSILGDKLSEHFAIDRATFLREGKKDVGALAIRIGSLNLQLNEEADALRREQHRIFLAGEGF